MHDFCTKLYIRIGILDENFYARTFKCSNFQKKKLCSLNKNVQICNADSNFAAIFEL